MAANLVSVFVSLHDSQKPLPVGARQWQPVLLIHQHQIALYSEHMMHVDEERSMDALKTIRGKALLHLVHAGALTEQPSACVEADQLFLLGKIIDVIDVQDDLDLVIGEDIFLFSQQTVK